MSIDENKTLALISRAKQLFAQGTSKAEIARQLDVSPRTVGRWLAKSDVPVASKPDSAQDAQDYDEDGEVDATPDYNVSVLATRKSISLSKIDKAGKVVDSVVVTSEAENFQTLFDLIVSSRMDQAVLNKAFALATPKTMVEELTQGKVKVNLRNSTITYTPDNGQPFEVSNKLATRIVKTLSSETEQGAEKILNFLNRLLQNPSFRAVNELYGFLSHNDIELTQEGKFYAWKVVRSDYMDKHSNTMLNAVGLDVRVNRNQVDENSEVTCSYGLHVCAKHYIRSFYSSGDRIVKVEVDPADVVAIPRDYNDSKMRCCGYKVVEDVTKSFYK